MYDTSNSTNRHHLTRVPCGKQGRGDAAQGARVRGDNRCLHQLSPFASVLPWNSRPEKCDEVNNGSRAEYGQSLLAIEAMCRSIVTVQMTTDHQAAENRGGNEQKVNRDMFFCSSAPTSLRTQWRAPAVLMRKRADTGVSFVGQRRTLNQDQDPASWLVQLSGLVRSKLRSSLLKYPVASIYSGRELSFILDPFLHHHSHSHSHLPYYFYSLLGIHCLPSIWSRPSELTTSPTPTTRYSLKSRVLDSPLYWPR